MDPIKRTDHNLTYKGEHEVGGVVVNRGVGDLSCRRDAPGIITSHWKPTQDEREILARGGVVEIQIHSEPIPPISLIAVEDEVPTGEPG